MKNEDSPNAGGERMFGAESLVIEETDGLIKVTAEDSGHSFTAYCRGKEK